MQPDISNVETPDWIASGAGLLLLIAQFFGWVHASFSVTGLGGSESGNATPGWAYISIISVLAVWAMLTLIILDVELPFNTWIVYAAAGGLAVLLAVIVIIFRPIGANIPGFGLVKVSKAPWIGSILALISGAGMLVGAWMKRQSEEY